MAFRTRIRSARSKAQVSERGASIQVERLHAGYGVDVLHGVDLEVGSGEVVALLGANGAGKSTLAKTMIGAIRPRQGDVLLDGESITRCTTAEIVRRGVAIVPEGRRIFARRTIEDNLYIFIAAWPRRREAHAVRGDIEELLDRFPILGRRRNAFAGSLSGGEAQLLAIAMALVTRPRLIVLDEPSLSLSPIAIAGMAREVVALAASGTSVLLIEQNARTALEVSQRAYVLELGRVTVTGTSQELRDNDAVQAAYLRM